MAKSYQLKEIIDRELSHPHPFGIHRTHGLEKEHSRLSNGNRCQFLDEAAIWKTALQLEGSGMELFD
jgi:hypothetical protein